MTIDKVIHKLDFSISAYQKLIDEHVSDGEVVGTGVRGTWKANTPLNKSYQDMIDAFQFAKDTMRKYQQIQEIVKVWHQDIYSKDFECMAEIAEVIEDGKIDTY